MEFKIKLLIAFFVLAIIIVTSVVALNVIPISEKPTREDWLNGWTYRMSHNITGSQGAGNDYQIKLIANYQSGQNQDNTFYLDEKCQSNFNDIRFTDDDGATLLSYWMESKTDGKSAIFWVKINDNLDTDQMIYVYYGNNFVNSASDIDSTFPFADDFSDSNINTEKWETVGSGDISLNDGICTLTTKWGDNGWAYIRGTEDFGVNYAIRYSSVIYNQAFCRWTHHGFGDGTPFTTVLITEEGTDKGLTVLEDLPNFITESQETTNFTWTWRIKTESNLTRIDQSDNTPEPGVYYTFEIQRSGNSVVNFYRDNVLEGSIDTNIPTVNLRAMFAVDNSAHDQTAVTSLDWILIRKCIDLEPSSGTWGNQQTING
ncbi:MAG: DUF2341 domain-containing protein [Candidatus Bathyarchaeota archaeon]|nr:DUF2341 domain-containing protein [Candidatus Bathyarchaeota archaeon]